MPFNRRHRLFYLWAGIQLLTLTAGTAAELSLSVCGEFTTKNPAVTGLSGITWAGGDQFYVVADRFVGFVPLTLRIDADSGKIASVHFAAPQECKLQTGDLEAIMWDAATKQCWVAGESPAGVQSVSLSGTVMRGLNLPAVFKTARPNLGIESLTGSSNGKRFWLANEETLKCDGATADASHGSIVRLTEFNQNGRICRQFAWTTEPAVMRFAGSGSGVADLCLLPDGTLLVLERGFSRGGLHCRIFAADFANATDIGKLPTLSGAVFQPASKRLLLDRATFLTNYEGITLGPKLSGGCRSVILVSDSGNSEVHHFLSLKLTGLEQKR